MVFKVQIKLFYEQIKIHTGIKSFKFKQKEHIFFYIQSSTTQAQLIKSTRSQKSSPMFVTYLTLLIQSITPIVYKESYGHYTIMKGIAGHFYTF